MLSKVIKLESGPSRNPVMCDGQGYAGSKIFGEKLAKDEVLNRQNQLGLAENQVFWIEARTETYIVIEDKEASWKWNTFTMVHATELAY